MINVAERHVFLGYQIILGKGQTDPGLNLGS